MIKAIKMKARSILILTFFLSVYTTEPEERIISIVDYRHQSTFPTANPSVHKNRDVEIYKINPIFRDDIDTNMVKAAYMPIIYLTRNNQLISIQEHAFEIQTHYEKASYYWLNDSTLKFKLYNNFNDLCAHYKYVLHRDGSSLGVDD